MKKSILSSDFDLLKLSREILKQGKSIRIQAKGWSMRPFILEGDFITVSPVENSSLKTGDVVLYSTAGNQVIVHRLIKKYIKDKRMTLLVKGDATFGSPEKVDVQNILGKVTAIERDGRKIRLDNKLHQIIGLFVARISPFSQWIYPVGSRVKHSGWRIMGSILEKLQGFKLYSILAKKLMKEDIDFQIASPDEAYSLSRHYGYNQGPEIGEAVDVLPERIKRSEDSDYFFVAKRKDKVIGSVTLSEFPESNYPYLGWWVFGLGVNWRYRGMGIGEKLIKMALEKATENGASEIKLLLFEDAKRAKNLYQKLGFQQISIPELDRQLAQEAKKTPRRRIILARAIKSG